MQRLLEKIGSSFPAKNIPVKAEAYATINNCFPNVKEKMSRDGGEIIYGWKLHSSILLIEAERHAVWKSTDGDLIDVTPNIESSVSISFVQESNGWVYDGTYTDNIRVNKTSNPLVDDYILLNELIFQLYKTSKRKSFMEITMLEPVEKLVSLFNEDKIRREVFIYSNATLDTACYCDSRLKYCECHGFDLKNIFSQVMLDVQAILKKSNI